VAAASKLSRLVCVRRFIWQVEHPGRISILCFNSRGSRLRLADGVETRATLALRQAPKPSLRPRLRGVSSVSGKGLGYGMWHGIPKRLGASAIAHGCARLLSFQVKNRPHVCASLAARLTDEQRLDIRKPDFIGPSVALTAVERLQR
jgi:hypothetical protein